MSQNRKDLHQEIIEIDENDDDDVDKDKNNNNQVKTNASVSKNIDIIEILDDNNDGNSDYETNTTTPKHANPQHQTSPKSVSRPYVFQTIQPNTVHNRAKNSVREERRFLLREGQQQQQIRQIQRRDIASTSDNNDAIQRTALHNQVTNVAHHDNIRYSQHESQHHETLVDNINKFANDGSFIEQATKAANKFLDDRSKQFANDMAAKYQQNEIDCTVRTSPPTQTPLNNDDNDTTLKLPNDQCGSNSNINQAADAKDRHLHLHQLKQNSRHKNTSITHNKIINDKCHQGDTNSFVRKAPGVFEILDDAGNEKSGNPPKQSLPPNPVCQSCNSDICTMCLRDTRQPPTNQNSDDKVCKRSKDVNDSDTHQSNHRHQHEQNHCTEDGKTTVSNSSKTNDGDVQEKTAPSIGKAPEVINLLDSDDESDDENNATPLGHQKLSSDDEIECVKVIPASTYSRSASSYKPSLSDSDSSEDEILPANNNEYTSRKAAFDVVNIRADRRIDDKRNFAASENDDEKISAVSEEKGPCHLNRKATLHNKSSSNKNANNDERNIINNDETNASAPARNLGTETSTPPTVRSVSEQEVERNDSDSSDSEWQPPSFPLHKSPHSYKKSHSNIPEDRILSESGRPVVESKGIGSEEVTSFHDNAPLAEEKKEKERVQCDSCERWTILPQNIADRDIPKRWACSMNTRSKFNASCNAEEDKYRTDNREDNLLCMQVDTYDNNKNDTVPVCDRTKEKRRQLKRSLESEDDIFYEDGGDDNESDYSSGHVMNEVRHLKKVTYDEETGLPVSFFSVHDVNGEC